MKDQVVHTASQLFPFGVYTLWHNASVFQEEENRGSKEWGEMVKRKLKNGKEKGERAGPAHTHRPTCPPPAWRGWSQHLKLTVHGAFCLLHQAVSQVPVPI